MAPVATLDAAVFRFINLTLSNPVFDWLMPFFSSNAFFFPCALVLAAVVVWKGGARARLCLVLLILAVVVGDNWICTSIKKAVARPRPFVVLKDARIRPPPDSAADDNDYGNPYKSRENTTQLVLRGSFRSMPSGHSANWFAAAMVAFIYYRRSVRFMLPLAATVAFSRVYNGVHYPGDVLAGAILGAGYAAAGIWMLDWAWQWAGKFWFPLWWKKLPSLINPVPVASVSECDCAPAALKEAHWLRLGYLLILALAGTSIGYIASDAIDLSQEEAFHWLWSKHPALSYVSDPPLIAWLHWVGTKLFGNTEMGVRVFSPVLAAVMSFVLLRFIAREINARLGFLLTLILQAIPLMAINSTLLTVDSLVVFFWTLAMITGWRAVQKASTTREWLWVGLWMGFAFLSKYNALGLMICWPVFFALWRPGRIQLRRPGFYCALVVSLLFCLPALIWNTHHDWAAVGRFVAMASMGQTLQHTPLPLGEFIGMSALLWNPVFFIAAAWAAMTFWSRDNNNPMMTYFFSMGAPVYLIYLVLNLHSSIPPSGIAPALLPLFYLMMIFCEKRAAAQIRWIKTALAIGLIGGLFVVVMMHETRLIDKITNVSLPGHRDPLRHVRGWKESAQVVNDARLELAKEGPSVFIVAGNYGVASELAFYVSESKNGLPGNPLVYCEKQTKPANQFYFWKGFESRKGQNAIYVVEADEIAPPSSAISDQFDSVTFLGSREIKYRGQPFHHLQIFACRNLR